MPALKKDQIKEIAEEFDIGMRGFWHRKTGELLFIPDLSGSLYGQSEFFDEEQERLDNEYHNFIEIERPCSKDAFEIMADFTEQLSDRLPLKNRLIYALERRKPFNGFNSIIHDEGEYREQWFLFKSGRMQEWVIRKFAEATFRMEDEK